MAFTFLAIGAKVPVAPKIVSARHIQHAESWRGQVGKRACYVKACQRIHRLMDKDVW